MKTVILDYVTYRQRALPKITQLILPYFIDKKDVLCPKVFRNVKIKEPNETYSIFQKEHKIKSE